MFDTRSINQIPTWYRETYGMGVVYEFKSGSAISAGTSRYVVLTTLIPWSDASGDDVIQVALYGTTVKRRSGNTTTLRSWS